MKKNKALWLSLLVMALWGSLFPMIKIGYRELGISSDSVPDILLFAGLRFVLSGLAVCVLSLLKKEKIADPKIKNISAILLMGFFSIVLHYGLLYIGLSSTDSAKAALLKQLGVLLYICFSFLFIRTERFSVGKIVGALIGFGGIVCMNFSGTGVAWTFGDLLIIGTSFCTVIANIISKKSVRGNSSYWITGISQFFGGIVLLAIAIALNAKCIVFNLRSAAAFAYICIASVVSYILWYAILKSSALSQMFIIKFTEPLFACLFGALLLGENIFKIQYLLSFIMISLGILLGNRAESKKKRT